MSAIANADERHFWSELKGDLWVRFQPRLDTTLARFGARPLKALDPRQGPKILDIGCGTGATTLAFAARLGPLGKILAVDLSRPMLRSAVARTDHLAGATSSTVRTAAST